MNIEVIAKANGVVTQVAGNTVDLAAPSIVRLDIPRADIAGFERQGHDLIVRLASGETVRIADYYPDNAAVPNDLVLREDDGHLWVARTGTGSPRFSLIKDLTELTATEQGGGSSLTLPAILGGVAAAGALAAVAGGGGGGGSGSGSGGDAAPSGGGTPAPGTGTGTGTGTPDTTPPAAPTATVRGDGALVTGRGEAGATVIVRNAAGTAIATAVVATDGTYSVAISPAQINAERLTVTQTDPAGNVSPAAAIQAPDLTAPVAPTATVDAAGTTVTGRGEAGATVTIRNATGAVLGTAVVAADGSYSITLTTPQNNGGTLTVTQSDPAGNASPAVAIAAPDTTPPAAPTVTINGTGTQVTGTGEPGATVTVRTAAGTPIGTAVVAADGSYTVNLGTPQANGGTLTVTQNDPAGNASPGVSVGAPDITPPAAPTITINPAGTQVSGTGEPGATVTITDPSGATIGTTVVAADGSYSVQLSTAQLDSQRIEARQSDAAGNLSGVASTIAPDLTAPAAPVAALDATGATVTGTGEPGARVSVRDAGGAEIGTGVVDAQGNYAVVLATAQINSQTLSVVQTDAAGNASPASALTAPDLTAPGAPTATVAADGASITGTGEPGATLVVRDPLNAVIATTTVAADGSYTVALSPAQVDGETLTVRQTDAASNVSAAATTVAPDLIVDTNPDAPTATVATDGSAVTGVALGGATITLYDANGNVIGTGVAAADGSYSVALSPARIDGETVRVTQTDADGDVSPPATTLAPDLTAPAAPVATIDQTGAIVSGTAEAGATVNVRAADGTVLGTATAGTGGAFTIALTPAQANGGTVTVTQADTANNVSAGTTLAAPDITAPAAPAATVSADGAAVTGTGEAGATVTVRDSTGTVLGTTTVAAGGGYSVALTPAQANGGTVAVTQTDATGNASGATIVAAPDITAPNAPTVQIDPTGATVTGTGEAGATVTVRDAGGVTLASAVADAQGVFTIPLTPPQIDRQPLTVVQTDAGGNVSAAATLTAPDLTAPTAPGAQIDATGTLVSGTGEIGATVTVRDAGGASLGNALVNGQGTYSIVLSAPQIDRQPLTVIQTDAANNISAAAPLTAPDLTAPTAPIARIDTAGTTVSGTAEAGATVTIRDATGTAIITAVADSQGAYSVLLPTPLVDRQPITVVQADTAGNLSAATPLTAPDLTPPPAPIAQIDATGAIVTGTGEAGATVTVRDALGGSLGTAIVNAQGNFSVVLTTAQIDRQPLSVVQADAAGNPSPTSPLTAPDLTAPLAPAGQVAANGASISGTGEAGATLTIRSPLGAVLATVTVDGSGNYVTPLNPAQVDGEVLTLRQADAAGNVSPIVTATAPDLVADTNPDAPTAAVTSDGASVTGVAIGGAGITVYDANGNVIATGTAAANGTYTVALTPAQVNSEIIRVTQTEADGDVSPPATATAPDLTPPAAPTATLDTTGGLVTGTGEVGATITVRGPGGAALGTATVAANGAYVVTLTPAQTNGEVLAVTQADAANNVSPQIALAAPDYTAPGQPVVSVGTDGTVVTGTGEPGTLATVTAGGAVLGTVTVAADGSFTVPLSTPQANGGTVSVTLRDASGNVSAPGTALAPDITAPNAPVFTVNANGTVVAGTGEAGATVTISAGGTILATAQVAPNGSFTATLSPQQNNGGTLTATQADAAGNVSAPGSATAPDLVAPAAPTATVSSDGASVSGIGEPGARIVITSTAGAPLGVAIVAADGSYTATLGTPQIDGERLIAHQTDGGGNVSPAVQALAPDLTAPAAPVLTISGNGTLATGTGEPGAIVTITGPGGTVIGTPTVAANGSFTVALNPPRLNGEAFTATQADTAGNVSPAANAIAPDLTAPNAPVATINGTGTIVTGTGEPGATVRITGMGGTALGTALVAADGSFTVTLTTAQANGQPLVVVQADAAGNVSAQLPLAAPDITAPTAPTATVAGNGTTVTGLGEAGATVVVTNAAGTVIGSTTAAANGSYSVTLTPAQANGEQLGVSQRDGAGNVSPVTPALAPDITAPGTPVATVAGNGTSVIGTGEAGATVTVTGAAGVLGTATVAANGSYVVQLATPQRDGQPLTVTQADAAGNRSGPAIALAPDTTAPVSPTATVSGDGGAVTGAGVAGSTITVRTAAGIAIGSAVVDGNGVYTATLSTPQRNGEVLSVSQADGTGNASPPVPAIAPDLTAPSAPTATVGSGGTVVTGTGEAGATVTIFAANGTTLGNGQVGANGSYAITLATPQRNGEVLAASQADAANNVSGRVTAIAPDLTAPLAPTALAVTGDGTRLTGAGEIGTRVEVRGTGGALLGTGTVGADGTFSILLTTPQVTGATLAVTLTDAANLTSGPGSVVAPFDIRAFDNSATVGVDLVPVGSGNAPAAVGSAVYTALVAVNGLNLQAQVLTTPDVRFTVQPGHTLATSFTFDASVSLGVASGYALVVQRFDGTQWVAVNGTAGASLLQLGVFAGDLTANQTLEPGAYRAFVTFDGGPGLGIGAGGTLSVRGTDLDYTDIGSIRPGVTSGNVITDTGVGGAVDAASPGTHIVSVTVNGTVTQVTADGTVVDGAWGTLVINLNGSYTYTPDADAAAIGKTDSFTYTIVDPSDGELESANLSIAIGSGAISGAPVAVADAAIAPVTYQNVVVHTDPAQAFSFNATGTLGLVAPRGQGTSTFSIAQNNDANITINATSNAGLAVAPTYTLTLTNLTTNTTQTYSNLALLNLGTASTSFTINGLHAGDYSYTVAANSTLSAGNFSTNVTLGRDTTLLTTYEVASHPAVQGELLANDTTHTDFAAVRINTGNAFVEVGNTPLVVNGAHGTLTVDEVGHYTYQTSANLPYSTVDLFDTFTYQIVQPNGTLATTTLTVTIDVPADGVATPAATFASTQMVSHEPDVISLDGLTLHTAASPAMVAAPDATAVATYDLFEGRGQLEDVLSHYLGTPTENASTGPLVSIHSAAAIDVAATTPTDPLGYLVMPEDPNHTGITANHVV